jgi:MFS superfamily sulfate permease-like transporter
VIVGSDGSIAALVGSAVIPLAADPADRAPLAALLAILVGAVFLGAWLARLGWIADYFSRPVLIGYIHGVAVVLIIGQLGNLLGLSISGQTPPAEVIEIVREITALSWTTFAVGMTCLVLLLLLGWLFPKIPGPLIVVCWRS